MSISFFFAFVSAHDEGGVVAVGELAQTRTLREIKSLRYSLVGSFALPIVTARTFNHGWRVGHTKDNKVVIC